MSKKIDKTKKQEKSQPPNRIEMTRHSNGVVQSETPYVNGKKHGLNKWWREDGSKWIEEIWRSGKKHGMATDWYESGRKSEERMRKEGNSHGLETHWYKSGEKWWEIMWRNGKRQGVVTAWYENGQKIHQTYYGADAEYACVEWDEKGNIIKTNFPTFPQTTTKKVKPIAKSKKIRSAPT